MQTEEESEQQRASLPHPLSVVRFEVGDPPSMPPPPPTRPPPYSCHSEKCCNHLPTLWADSQVTFLCGGFPERPNA
ncbi:hypothetical protein JZ751_024503 [Albula glossodonta]|uniref:Uncharacterized protein n=1 Tax=Albula glossodonta TaxID=121402 RepID=A0A8T2PDH7_9TELE|nr:hypothetical protein JZ751_024503 [Albula glossodonta]